MTTLTHPKKWLSELSGSIMQQKAEELRRQYIQAQPFPHIVLDDFFPPEILTGILSEFPAPHSGPWQMFDNPAERKLASNSELQMGEQTRNFLYQLNSSTFITFLETLTGIDGIIPDPHFVGGGLHQIERGGYLKLHADFNRHTRLKLDRRLNLLLYLNQDWLEEYGGHLQLWDRQMANCEKKILPVFNRMVIFSTTDWAYHGHPDPLTCPEGRTRKSLALYYYTNGRPEEEVFESHSTLFRARPGESVESEPSLGETAKTIAKKLLPPIIFDITRAIRNGTDKASP